MKRFSPDKAKRVGKVRVLESTEIQGFQNSGHVMSVQQEKHSKTLMSSKRQSNRASHHDINTSI